MAVLDIEETKTHHEIIGWRIINDKRLQELKNQAVREGGQILTSQDDNLRASSDQTEPGNLSNTVTPEAEKSSEVAGKVEEKAKKNLERLKQEQQRWKNWHTDAELMTANGQEAKIPVPDKAETPKPAAKAKPEPETKVAEKAEMPKTEETATAKTPEIVRINTVSEITDEDFQKPYRSLELPSLPERTLNAIGKEAKPVLLKLNILEKNRNQQQEQGQHRYTRQDAQPPAEPAPPAPPPEQPYNPDDDVPF